MKQPITIVSIALAIAAAAVTAPAIANADSGDARQTFVGLWEAVDPSDGSLTQRSISCDQAGVCAVLGSDSFWVVCGSPRGILRGEGSVVDGVLSVPGFTLSCTDGPTLTVATTFVPDRRNRTLIEQHANPNIGPIVFHRVTR